MISRTNSYPRHSIHAHITSKQTTHKFRRWNRMEWVQKPFFAFCARLCFSHIANSEYSVCHWMWAKTKMPNTSSQTQRLTVPNGKLNYYAIYMTAMMHAILLYIVSMLLSLLLDLGGNSVAVALFSSIPWHEQRIIQCKCIIHLWIVKCLSSGRMF